MLIIHGKYFVSPSHDEKDFKELFSHLASVGAGRQVGPDGVPSGPWTAELLIREIAENSPDGSGVDLGSV